MDPKKYSKQENKNRTKRSNITPNMNMIYEKKMKQGPTPDVLMNKTHHQTTINSTTTNPNMTKHKRTYLLKERERRQIQRSRIKKQKKPTKLITETTIAQKDKEKRIRHNTLYEYHLREKDETRANETYHGNGRSSKTQEQDS